MSSAPAACNAALQDLLLTVGRGLLQYLGEVPPWTTPGEANVRQTLVRLVASQQESIADLAEMLAQRHALPELGTYPEDLTAMNDLAFGFVQERLIADQQHVVAAVEQTLATCEPSAGRVLRRVRQREAGHLEALQELRTEQPSEGTGQRWN